MIGAGTVINPIVRIVTVVAILAAVYVFAIRPALDTTEHISDSVTNSVNKAQRDAQKQIDNAFKSSGFSSKKAKQVKTELPNSANAQLKVAKCVQRAAGDINKMQKCLK